MKAVSEPTNAKSYIATAKFVGVMLAAVIASSGANWYQKSDADQRSQNDDARLSVLESKQQALLHDTVPRAEHEARWKSEDQQLSAMQQDIREIRRMVERRQEADTNQLR